MIASAFMSSDNVLRREAYRSLIAQLVDPKDEAFRVKTFQGDEVSARDIVVSLNTPTFTGDSPVIVVHNSQRLSSEDSKELAEAISKDDSGDSFLLLLVDTTDPKNKFSPLLKSALKTSLYQLGGGTKNDKVDTALKFVRTTLESADMQVSHSIITMIVEKAGVECNVLKGELTKLIDYVATPQGPGVITETSIQEVIAANPEDMSFKLMDSIVAGDLPGALTQLQHQMRNAEKGTQASAFQHIGLLSLQLTRVWHIKSLLASGINVANGNNIPDGLLPVLTSGDSTTIADVLKKNPWMARRLVSQAKNADWEFLRRGFEAIEWITERLKSSDKILDDPELVMSLGIIRMCRK